MPNEQQVPELDGVHSSLQRTQASNRVALPPPTFVRPPMKKEARDVILSFRIARSMADRIDYYQTIHHRRKTDAVIDLLELALFIAENAQKLKDPEIVTYLRNNLYNIQLVDDIMQWPQDRIDAIVGALLGEKDRRLRVRI